MGKKRFCAILLVFAMILSMGPLTIPVMAVNNSPGTQQPLDIQFTTDPGAIVSETTGLDISQSGPWNLTIKSTVSNTSNAYVVLLGYHLYEGHFDANNTITNINASNFDTKDDVLQNIDRNYKPYYKTQKTEATIGTETTLFNQSLTSFSVTESSTAFHQKYVALIFDQAHDTDDKSDYTIVTFYVNKDGYLQTNSYLLRYQSNPRPAGGTGSSVGSLPSAVITEWGTDAALTTSKPSRNGYNFLGWDSDGTKVSTDPNTAAAATADSLSVEFPAGGTDQKVSWTKAAAKFGSTTFNGASDKIYDVYAIWQPRRVRFKTEDVAVKKDTATVTVPSLGTRTDVPVMELPAPRVGQAYSYTLDLGGTTDSNTGKTFGRYSTASITLSDGSAAINASNLTSFFDSDSLQTTTPTNMQTRLTGTPTKDNDGPLYFLMMVSDNVNKTDDWAVIKFPKINKGAQPVPSIDDNTGLETRLEQKDGQIFGFYSNGPTLATYAAAIQANSKNGYFTQDNANPPIAGISGSGAMTNYYLRYGMVFEYRPKVINGETVSYEKQTPVDPDTPETPAPSESPEPTQTPDTPVTQDEVESGSDDDNPEEPKKTYADMPNGGWREVPFPSSWYTNANKTAMEASLGSNTAAATKVIYSTGTPTLSGSNVTGGSATVQDITPTGFDGWLESYGYIAFSENGLPVIHGLKENDEYEVRFRASATRDESAAQTLKIGGGGGGPSGTDGILAITAQDFDGEKIGTFVFRSDSNPTTQKANADAAIKEFVAQEKVANILKSHPGYDFLTWVREDYKDENGNKVVVPTSYGKRVDSVDPKSVVSLELDPADQIDFSTLQESITVRAAYTTNDSIELGATAADDNAARDARRYKATVTPTSFSRYGTGNSYGIQIKVERGNVPRVTDGILLVNMSIGGASIYSQYELKGSDEETVDVVAYAQSSTSGQFFGAVTVEWTIADKYQLTNWIGAGPRTTQSECVVNASFTVKRFGSTVRAVWDTGTYAFEGVVDGINQALASYHSLKLKDPSITPSNQNMSGITTAILQSINIPPLSQTTARNNLYNKYLANGANPLSYADIYEAASGTPLS